MKRFLALLFAALVPAQAFAGDALQIVTSTMFPDGETNGGGALTTHPLQSSTDSLEVLFQCDKAVTITKLGYTYGVRTGTPPTYQIDLEGVNLTTGRADGTIKSSTNAKATFTPPADTTQDGTTQYKTLTASYACTKGEFLAEVIKYSSGTVNASNMGTFAYQMSSSNFSYAFPYSVTVASGSGTKRDGPPVYAYSDGTTYYGNPLQNFSQDCYSTATEDAVTFTIPSSWCSTIKLKGAIFYGATPNAGKDTVFNLYSGVAAGSTTVLDTATLDGDVLSANGSSRVTRILFTTETALTCGNGYRISAAPNAASASFCMESGNVGTNAEFSAWPWGINTFFSTRSGGNWTDTNTKRPLVKLIWSDITAPSGGTGLWTGMNRGMEP